MQKDINKYESKLMALLEKMQKNPVDSSTKFTVDRMTNGIAMTALQNRMAEIDGNPEVGRVIGERINQVIDASRPNINTNPPSTILDFQNEDQTSRKFDVQPDDRPTPTINPKVNINTNPPSSILDLQDEKRMSLKDVPKIGSIDASKIESTKTDKIKAPEIKLPTGSKDSSAASGLGNLGKTGSIIQAVAPSVFSTIDALMTNKNNNAFADYGREGLNTLQETERNINVGVQDRLNNIVSESNSNKRSIDENTTSLNVGRALKAGVDAAQLKAETDTTVAGLQQQTQLDSLISQTQNQRDQVVMQGNDVKAERDAQDLSAIISNFSASTQSAGKGMAHIEKMQNVDTYNDNVLGILNQAFPNINFVKDADGKVVVKAKAKA